MRHNALLTTLLLTAGIMLSPWAQADDESFPMTTYRNYMAACVEGHADQIDGEDLDADSDTIVAAFALKCQCEYGQMPASGNEVTRSIYNTAQGTCQAEFDKDNEAFVLKYAEQIDSRIDELQGL